MQQTSKSKLPIVVIDPHGEYSSLCVENDDYDEMIRYNVQVTSYADKVVEYTTDETINPHAKKFSLSANFSMEELLDLIPINLTEKEKSVLYSALQDMDEDYSLTDLMERIEEEPTKFKWKVLDGLSELMKSGVFSGYPTPYSTLVSEGVCSIINLKGTLPSIQQLIVARLTRELFEKRKMGKIPELFYLVEESHNFCPERGFGDVMSSSILRTIAGEGRKFGVYLCVVSQRPARVDKNVLSQCNTQVILKVTNPNDLKAIRQSIEGFSAGMEEEIQALSVGHALVVTETLKQPVTIDVRCRETKHGAKPKYTDDGQIERNEAPPEVKKMLKKRHKEKKEIILPSGEKMFVEKNKNFLQKLKAIFIKDDDEVGGLRQWIKNIFIHSDDKSD